MSVLAQERTKPAIPFAGKYRIIDFTLNNCVNSGINKVDVLTQYQPLSLAEHIGIGAPWGLATPDRGIRLLQAYLAREEGRDWYKGTADAVYQNLQNIEEQNAELVLVLSGDHVYKMNYSWMLKYHGDRQADVTLAVTQMPDKELHQFGSVTMDPDGKVTSFKEKSKQPESNFISMGVYLFKKDILQKWLIEDAQSITSQHDFGRNVFPRMLNKSRIFAYHYKGYWRDIGTVSTYWQANMDIIEMSPGGYLSDAGWPIRTSEIERPSAIISENANVINSLISDGCVVEGHVEHSVLSPGVIIDEGAVVKDSIILSDTVIGSHSVVDYSIVDEGVVVQAGCYLGSGDDFQVNRREPKEVNTGITIVGKGAKLPPGLQIGRNCVIWGGVGEDDFHSSEVKSGESIKPKRRGAIRRA